MNPHDRQNDKEGGLYLLDVNRESFGTDNGAYVLPEGHIRCRLLNLARCRPPHRQGGDQADITQASTTGPSEITGTNRPVHVWVKALSGEQFELPVLKIGHRREQACVDLIEGHAVADP